MEAKLIDAQNDFGTSVLKTLAKESSDNSLVVSPFSLLNVLAIANVGSKGKTAEELASLFGTSSFFHLFDWVWSRDSGVWNFGVDSMSVCNFATTFSWEWEHFVKPRLFFHLFLFRTKLRQNTKYVASGWSVESGESGLGMWDCGVDSMSIFWNIQFGAILSSHVPKIWPWPIKYASVNINTCMTMTTRGI